jgi:micrococcal nuclease
VGVAELLQAPVHPRRGVAHDGPMTAVRRLLPVVLVLVVAVGLVLRAGREDAPAASDATVVRVVDGDTIVARLGTGREERVRYIGVDTPESVKPGTPVQCFAEAASEFNASLVEGRRVRLVGDVEARDRYGRLLAYVYREPDEVFVNAELVRQGYARPATFPPNVRFAGRFAALAAEAREAARGLWKAC